LVSVAKPVKQKPKAYSDAEIKKFFEAMTDEEYERYAFFLATGCREQEVMFATWDDIDFAGKTYKVEGKSVDSEEFRAEESRSARDSSHH